MYTYVNTYRLFIVDINAKNIYCQQLTKQVNRMAGKSHSATDMHGQTDKQEYGQIYL